MIIFESIKKVMNTELPKVLIVSSEPFSTTKNNGKTLSSFFENYGIDCLAQFSFSGNDCNKNICDKYFFLTNNDVISKKSGKSYRAKEIDVKTVKYDSDDTSLPRRIFHSLSQARIPLAVLLKNRVWGKADYSKALEWIDEFHPEVVFFQGFSMIYGYNFVLNICKSRNIPLILELTDDYTQILYPLSLVERINNKQYLDVFSKAIKVAYKTIVISDLMKEEYESRFGGNMDVMMNSIDVVAETSCEEKTPNDYVYAGNLLLNRWKVLRNLGKALLRTNPEAVLNIYTPDIPPKKIINSLQKVHSIHYGGRLSKDELKNRLNKCEYVVHVEAFDVISRNITRLSMSTKIPEYIASKAKIIAIGPENVASMRCLAEKHIGKCINSPSVNQIVKALTSSCSSGNYERTAIEFVQKCCSTYLNSEQMKKHIICAVASTEESGEKCV